MFDTNYCKINSVDVANGTGVRVSLFVSGCRNHCKGCFNKETWDFNYGEEFTSDTVNEILKLLEPAYIKGLSILGGDPFEPENIKTVLDLCRKVKKRYPLKDIWVYTGYFYEEFNKHPIMNSIDVLVDGQFIEELKDISLKFRGSSNQKIIDVKASISSGSIVLAKEVYENV